MAKRFTSTDIWDEDWFLEMPVEYKLFWYYMLSTCNHAGLFKVNLRSFCGLNEVKVGSKEVLEFFNAGKQRIRVINHSLWLIEDFFFYQYGTTFNGNNRVHESIRKEYLKHHIDLTSIRGLKDLKDGVKDKDKDKDIDKDKSVLHKESENENNFLWVKVVKDFHNDFIWKEKFCRDKTIQILVLEHKMKEFISDIELREEFKPLPELKSHFFNWYTKHSKTNGHSRHPQRELSTHEKNIEAQREAAKHKKYD